MAISGVSLSQPLLYRFDKISRPGEAWPKDQTIDAVFDSVGYLHLLANKVLLNIITKATD